MEKPRKEPGQGDPSHPLSRQDSGLCSACCSRLEILVLEAAEAQRGTYLASLQDAPLPSRSASSPVGHSRILRTRAARAPRPGHKEQALGPAPSATKHAARPLSPQKFNSPLKSRNPAAAWDPAPPQLPAPARSSKALGCGAQLVVPPFPFRDFRSWVLKTAGC